MQTTRDFNAGTKGTTLRPIASHIVNSLSIIIVTYNSAETVGRCLRSLVGSLGTLMTYEIIVVDNHSTDATPGMIKESFPSVMMIAMGRNEGFAAAANTGAARASGNILFFLNPDTEVQENFAAELIRVLEQYPRWDIMGFQFADFNGNIQPSAWRPVSLGTLFVESFLPYRASLPLVTASRVSPSPVPMVSGGCMLVRKNVFETLSHFDTDYFLYYEDVDFCWRARNARYDILLVPSIKIAHHGRKSFPADLTGFFPALYSGKLAYCSKHFSPIRYFLARTMILAGIAVRIAAYRIAGMASGSDAMKTLAEGHLEALRSIRGV